ncbi:FAST kinase domain-containing protein 3, mitochondrial [Pristis pectinata]|uniref:FAST kinase domain-containing protein 3, mitochondrial n=1 Tax=Pristis pectinata TaxID=685728 RepID=UPI00223DDC5A|nr:FAST kinase domain-containing protein 3, mitochondrial [Pristis pectinata]XP_051871380.1 FAST kinase domain-containing protein 3, mitochondrial [Pristis pectinata]XP_051871382.1 FAST kinase domain-containing protein 3, mitochondrial [Pristis pectinata]XP_051871383.1 FAST kinase domain-containing protein 3, mitochondrial [Pristis pectinata]XP_051871384.1 FAST kinase domain-containing protein 3, mitochondrial [Pristis pectinata]XP_051871385.1 FAST kinase domain-containing protein 3, mitochond
MALNLLRLFNFISSKFQTCNILQIVRWKLYPCKNFNKILYPQCSQILLTTCLKVCHQWVPHKGYHCVARDQPGSTSGTVCLHGDAGDSFEMDSKQEQSSSEEEFLKYLNNSKTAKQIFKLLKSSKSITDIMAASALLKISQVEKDGNGLRNPAVLLENETVKALCFQFEQESERLSTRALVTALYACVQLYVDPQSTLMMRLLSESQERFGKGQMLIKDLCLLGNAFLDLEGPSCGILKQIMEQIQGQEMDIWTSEELTMVYNLLGAGVGEGGNYQELLNKMNSCSLHLASRLSHKAKSDILNAMVVLKQTQAIPLVINLCKHSVRHIPHFSDQELIPVLNALMCFGISDRFFIDALERNIPKKAFVMQPEAISKVMQYCNQQRILSPPIFDAVAESFVYNSDNFTTKEIALQIMPFGRLNYLPPNAGQLFRKIESLLRGRFSQFQPQTLLNLLHSCILIGRFPVNFVSKIFSPYFLQLLEAQGNGLDKFVLAQLTQLFMTMKLECRIYEGPSLPPKYRVKSFFTAGHSLESLVDEHLYGKVKNALTELLGARNYFASRVLTPYGYTLDAEIKLDEEGYVLPASWHDEVFRRIALCIDDQRRFAINSQNLLGKEAIKQRQLQLLGYDVVQIPFYELDKLQTREEMVEYLHKKIFPHSYRLAW